MKTRSQVSKKMSRSSAQEVQPSLQSRPFAPPAQPDPSRTMADVQAQLEHAQRYGHSLSKYSLSPSPSAPPMIQPKLTIGAPGDKYEQEADHVAQQVVQWLNAPKLGDMQSEQTVQRETLPEEEDELQMKSMVQRLSDSVMPASEDLESAIAQARCSGQSLPDTIRHPMENAFGVDFSDVKIHADTQADRLNQSIQAMAFTTGQDVFFRKGAYQPRSRGGQELIAHELTHVVQQNIGVVQRNGGNYELVGKKDEESTLSFIHNDQKYEDRLVVKEKGADDKTALIGAVAEVRCITGDNLDNPGDMILVTRDMVNAYWETLKEELDDSLGNQGSFSSKKGYQRDEKLGPSAQYNCAAYAHGKENIWIEPEDMHKILNEEYDQLNGEMELAQDYVAATQFHFFRLKKNSENEYETSEKNGPSAVYHRKIDKEKFLEEIMTKQKLKIYKIK